MIRVLIPYENEFEVYKNECQKLYESLQDKIGDTNSFEFIIQNTLFYMFLEENILIGAIYYFVDENNRLSLNGFAKRKMHKLCLECLKMSLNWFKGKIYAQSQNKASAYILLQAGFKRENGNLFFFNPV